VSERNRELSIIISIVLLIVLGLVLINGALNGTLEMTLNFWLMVSIFFFIFFITNISVRLLAKQSTPYLLPISMLLSGVGLITIFRLEPAMASMQLIWLAIGLSTMILVMLVFENYKNIRYYKYIIGITGVIFLLLPIFKGVTVGGSRLWIDLGFVRFQPSEFAKVFLVLFFAAYLEEKKEVLQVFLPMKRKEAAVNIKHLGPLIVMWMFSLLILVYERDLGTSLLFFTLFIVMLYLGTGRLSYTLIGSVMFVFGAVACYFAFTHVHTRVDIWLNPWSDVSGSGYQIVQSLFAIANGRMTGTGLGNGFPGLIPAVKTDFIFSAICEENGFLGGAAIVLSYLLFVYAGFKVALQSKEELGKMVAAGLTVIFGFQAFLIIAGVTKLLPLTGVTLPFISYGGSSVVANFMIVGILLAVSNKERSVG
jgi:cell division protein FtsW (lipid II flippase)